MLYQLFKPLLFRLDAEQAHDLITGLFRVTVGMPLLPALLRAYYAYDDPRLRVQCAGIRLSNPIGLAAGFDKRAALIGAMELLGFGFIEVGTVTPRPQPGNDRPRLFRLPGDRALINRLGFNSPGMLVTAQQLRSCKTGIPVGINIGKNRTTALEQAVEDYVATFSALAPFADYIAINISSPNTPGLRRLHERTALEGLLRELTSLNRRLPHPRPMFLKVSPDETPAQLAEVVQVGIEAGITGFIATNTTLARTGLRDPASSETGGLSGHPLTRRARQVIARIYQLSNGSYPIIGVGGVATAEDAYEHIRAGATLVQIYTGLIYEGPAVVRRIKKGIVRLLHRDGYDSIAKAVGTANTR